MTQRDPVTASGSTLAGGGAELDAVIYDIERLVSRGAPASTVYHAVLRWRRRPIGGDSGSLRFVDAEDPTWTVAVAWRGSARVDERWRNHAPITEGVSGRVISTGQPFAAECDDAALQPSRLVPLGVQALVGVPLRELDRVVGSLVVGSMIAGHRWTRGDQDLLLAYAARVEVALAVAAARQAVQQAHSDPLTGLGNRRRLFERLQHELVRADRAGESVTMLLLDLDRFKAVNDSFGHLAGDQLLIAAAERLRGCVRTVDSCFRVGGDEFAVLLARGADPAAVAERIIDALQARFQIGEHEVLVGVSVGIASGLSEAEMLIRDADAAMYEAKRAGTSGYKRFESHS